jgi:hypothetical protein
MKKIVKNFTGFSKLYENENQDELIKKGREALEQAEDDVKKITSDDTGIVDKLKDAAKNNNNNNTISKEVKESVSNPSLSTVKGLTNLVMKLKEYVIPKLPVVKGSYPEGWKIGGGYSQDDFLPGSTYKAYDMMVQDSWGTGSTRLNYKDEKGNNISFYVYPTTEEINHVRGIFVEACERTKWISFLRTTGVVSGVVLAAAGVAVILYGIYSKYQAFDEWKQSFYDKGQDYPKTITTSPFDFGSDVQGSYEIRDRRIYTAPDFSENPMTGYGVLGGELGKDVLAGAGGILGGVLLSLGSSKIDSDKEILNQIASIAGLLKASLEPLGMNVSDLKTAGDITAVLTTNQN